MNNPAVFLVLGLGAAGMLSGYTAKRLSQVPAVSTPRGIVREKSPAAHIAAARSPDTLEQLAALDGPSLYSRLARWMVTASEAEVAGFWEIYQQENPRDPDIPELIFINWTRLAPSAAITAGAVVGDADLAWRAWASTDPQAALLAAIDAGSDCLTATVQAIGYHHPEWLRAHFDLLPESARKSALKAMDWSSHAHAKETLELLKEHDQFNPVVFTTLVRNDPWAAYEWFQQNRRIMSGTSGDTSHAMELLVTAMGESQPEVLTQLAKQTPAGLLKWKMEAALFENLLATDPQAALQEAKSTQAPVIAAERLAAVGSSLAKSDPAEALVIASLLFPVSSKASLQFPDGTRSGSQYAIPGVYEFFDALIATNPAGVLELAISRDGISGQGPGSLSHLTQQWAQDDLPAYANWVNRQSDPAIRSETVTVLINQLKYDKQYPEAIEWAMSSESSKKRCLESLLRSWRDDEPAAALQWLESAALPEEERRQLIKETKPFGN